MPLESGKSKEAFNKNVSTEVNSGKKLSQAVAIAYSEKKHSDILPTPKYKDTLQSYGLSSLKNNNGAVTSPQQARQIASQASGQSNNQGRKMDNSRSKLTSSKIDNPDYFKNQSLRKMHDGGPGSGPHGGAPTKPVEIQKGTGRHLPLKVLGTKGGEMLPQRTMSGSNTPPKQNVPSAAPNRSKFALDPKKIAESQAWSNKVSSILSKDGGPGSGPQDHGSRWAQENREKNEFEGQQREKALKNMSNSEYTKIYGISKKREMERKAHAEHVKNQEAIVKKLLAEKAAKK